MQDKAGYSRIGEGVMVFVIPWKGLESQKFTRSTNLQTICYGNYYSSLLRESELRSISVFVSKIKK